MTNDTEAKQHDLLYQFTHHTHIHAVEGPRARSQLHHTITKASRLQHNTTCQPSLAVQFIIKLR